MNGQHDKPGHEPAQPLVSILVPAYNEADILVANLGKVAEYLGTLSDSYRWEYVIVDDGSTDGTGERADEFAAGHPDTRVLRHGLNRGLGSALRTGFSECEGRYIVVIDVDLTYAPEHIGALLERIRSEGADIVIASPYMEGGQVSDVPFMRKWLSRMANRFLALSARGANHGNTISTLTGMVRAYDAGFVRALNLKSVGMEINTEIIYKGLILGARIEEIPAHIDWSAQGELRTGRTSAKSIRRRIMLSLFTGYSIRPFAFFIIPAILLALVSLYPTYWIFYHVIDHYEEAALAQSQIDFAISEAVARAFRTSPHAFIVGGITMVLSVQLFSLGILALQVKHNFEELVHFSSRLYSRSRELERLLAEQNDTDPPAGERHGYE